MSAPKVDLIRQALSAAESSIKLARQLLSEVESEVGRVRAKPKELPGVAGMFDGQSMVTEKGEKFPVPENYASKSILVVGDTLKLVEDGGQKRFKQIEHVKRHKTTGILAKKDGKWAVVTPEGSYRVLNASIDHFSGQAGDEVLLQLPANSLQTTWGAVENISKKGKEETRQEVKEETKGPEGPRVEEKKEEKPKEKQEEPKEKKEEPKAKEEKREEKTATAGTQKEKETPKEVKEKPEARSGATESKSVHSEPKPAPVEQVAKPAVVEVKPAPAEAKPLPAEPKPASVESKPTAEQAAEDELT